MPRWAKIVLGVLGGLVLLVGIGIFVLTQTDFGRERVRRLALDQLAGSVHGNVRIGKIRGNLLTGATLDDVVITDSAGAPFLRADRVSLRYSLRSLISKRLYFSKLQLVRPVIVLDKRPGEEWNFARIFPSDTVPSDTTTQGFGSWVRIQDLSVRDGRLLVRNEWEPDSTLSGAARDSAIADVLSPENRLYVVQVAGGYQSVQDFRELNARLPLLRLADPDSSNIRADVDSLSTVAYLFRPPAAVVRQLAGRFIVSDDSLWFQNVRATLPASQLAAEGAYALEAGGVRASLRAAPVSLADLQWLYPALPDTGGGTLQLAVSQAGDRTRVVAQDVDLQVEGAQLAGHADVQFGDSLRLGDTDIRFANVDTRLIERLAPETEVPAEGTLNGQLALNGTASALRVDGRVAFQERGGGTSRVFADGEIGTGEGLRARNLRLRFDPVRLALARSVQPDLPVGGTITGQALLNGSTTAGFDVDADLVHRDPQTGRSRLLADGEVRTADGIAARNLTLRFEPFQVALARAFAPDLPVGGTITGRATVNGSPDTRIAADLNLLHQSATGPSRVVGDVVFVPGEPQRFNVDMRAPTLSLATLGRFAPAAELQGSASGSVRARGTLGDLALALQLAPEGGGTVDARGTFDLASASKRYDLTTRFNRFDAGVLTARAPNTLLSGTVTAQGRGTELATMQAVLSANLTDAQVDSAGVDAARVLVRVDNGLATFEQGTVRLASAAAEIEGSFGLVAGRNGTLQYRVVVDSLADFAQYLPGDTGAVQPRPAEQAQIITRARADSARFAQATEVERAATGRPAEPALRVDTIPPLQQDSVAGSIRAAGTLAGNIERFDLRGTAELDTVVVAGSALRSGRAEYSWYGAGTPQSSLTLAASLDSVRAAGFAFDSVSTRVEFSGAPDQGAGTADVAIHQDPDRDYRFKADYLLELDRREIVLDDVALRFDTTFWTSAQPGAVRWGGSGVELETIELTNRAGGRIYADGRLPSEGPADLEVTIDRLQIGDVLALVQDTVQATGLLSLRAELEGTARDPRLQGETTVLDASYDGTQLPALRARFGYADTQLETQAELLRNNALLAAIEGQLPVNLALSGYEGPRLLDRPLVIDIRADSLPLDALPEFTDAVSDVQGRVRGNVAVRGTFDEPDVDGVLNLDMGSLNIVAPGVALRDIGGTLRIREDVVVVDSLVARSGSGPIRLAGTLDISTPSEPGFDLALDARNAVVLDNELGREIEADADLTIRGPFDRVQVAGDVLIQEGTLFIPESDEKVVDLEDPALERAIDSLSVAPELVPEENALLANLQVDVGVRISRNTWVRNAEANVEIYTPEDAGGLRVRIDRQRQALGLEGVVNTDRGEYAFAGRRFDLTSGSATFLGGTEIDPLLQLTAVHEIPQAGREALAIQINIGGYLTEPRITLSSNAQPPITQSDLISYLAFGRSSTSLLGQGNSGLAGGGGGGGNLGALVTQQLGSVALGAVLDQWVADLEEGANRSGVDVIRISPSDDLPEELQFGDFFDNLRRGTEIEAGKYVNRRLFISAQGRAVGAWPGIRIEYRTPNGFRWVTTSQPRYLPSEPSFATDQQATQDRVFGSFLFWERRF